MPLTILMLGKIRTIMSDFGERSQFMKKEVHCSLILQDNCISTTQACLPSQSFEGALDFIGEEVDAEEGIKQLSYGPKDSLMKLFHGHKVQFINESFFGLTSINPIIFPIEHP